MSPHGFLNGIRVLDLGTTVVARLAARLLCDLSADVVRPAAGVGIAADGVELSPDFDSTVPYIGLLDRGKAEIDAQPGQSIAEWLSDQLGQASLVVLDAGSPPLESFLSSITPIPPSSVTITAFGQQGPKRGWRGGDLIAQASGGLLRITGEPGLAPLPVPADLTTGVVAVQAAIAGLAAVRQRRLTGSPVHSDVSAQDAVVAILEGAVTPLQFSGSVRERMGTMHPAVHGIGLQTTRDDRWVLFGTCPRPAMWTSLIETLGNPDWASRPEWTDARQRRADHVAIDTEAAQTVGKLDLGDFYDDLLSRGVPVGVVNDLVDVVTWDQIVERDFMIFGTDDPDDSAAQPGLAYRSNRRDT